MGDLVKDLPVVGAIARPLLTPDAPLPEAKTPAELYTPMLRSSGKSEGAAREALEMAKGKIYDDYQRTLLGSAEDEPDDFGGQGGL